MKIPPIKIDAFLKNPTSHHILIYGQDSGLIKERAKFLANSLMKNFGINEKLTFQCANLTQEIDLIYEKISNLSFFSPQPLIIIDDCSGLLSKSVKELIENSKDVPMIFIAGDLPASSGWRKFFEDDEKKSAIACYPLEIPALKSYVLKKLAEENLKIEPQALDFFCQLVMGDFLRCKSDVEKLINYMQFSKNQIIDHSIIEKSVSEPINEEIDDLCSHIISKESAEFGLIFNKLIKSSVQHVTIIRFMLFYLQRLLIVSNAIENGLNENEALNLLKPPIFFKQKADFIKNLRMTKSEEIIRKIAFLNQVEIQSKQDQDLAFVMMDINFIEFQQVS